MTVIVGAAYGAWKRGELSSLKTSSDAWREERDAVQVKAGRLEQERHAMEVELAELRGKTDLSALSRQIDETSRAFADQLTLSFAQLNEEHRSLMAVMEREAKLAEERHVANQKIITTLLERRREE